MANPAIKEGAVVNVTAPNVLLVDVTVDGERLVYTNIRVDDPRSLTLDGRRLQELSECILLPCHRRYKHRRYKHRRYKHRRYKHRRSMGAEPMLLPLLPLLLFRPTADLMYAAINRSSHGGWLHASSQQTALRPCVRRISKRNKQPGIALVGGCSVLLCPAGSCQAAASFFGADLPPAAAAACSRLFRPFSTCGGWAYVCACGEDVRSLQFLSNTKGTHKARPHLHTIDTGAQAHTHAPNTHLADNICERELSVSAVHDV